MNSRENLKTQATPGKTHPPPNLVRSLVVSLALVAATAAVYSNVRKFESVTFDDPGYVFENPQVLRGLSWNSVSWAFTSTKQSNWHPLTWLSHMADCQLYGPRPGQHGAATAAGWHHVTSVVLHMAAAVLLFFVLKRMTRAFWASAMVASLFALHPLHVESVAWIAERKDVLSTLLAMLALGAYALYAERPSVWRMTPVVVFLALGLMAKPMLVTLPLVMLLLDYWPLGRIKFKVKSEKFKVKKCCRSPPTLNFQLSTLNCRSGRDAPPGNRDMPAGARDAPAANRDIAAGALPQRKPVILLLEKMPLLALAAASSVVTYCVQHSAGSMVFGDAIPLDIRAENVAAAYAGYLGKALWPTHLAVFYPYPREVALWYVHAAALAAVTVLVVRAARARPYLVVGWLWYLGMLVPVIGLVQVGAQAMADRYTYMPLIGIFIIVVWGAADLLAGVPWRRYVLAPLGGGAIVACAALAWGQVQCWSNSFDLFSHAAEVTKDNALAYFNLGQAMRDMNEPAEAVVFFQEALKAHPDRFPFAHNNLGLAYVELGAFDPAKYEDAKKEFLLALADEPNFPEAHNNLGLRYSAAGQHDKAVEEYRQCIKLNPELPQAHYNLGRALAQQGKLDEARRELTEALRWAPYDPDAHDELGRALWRQGNHRAAADSYRRALQLSPDKLQSLNNLAWLLATDTDPELRDGAEAVRLAERACQLTDRKVPDFLDTLAAAYAEAGRFAEAVQVAQEALRLVPSAGRAPDLAANIAGRLELYKAGTAFRAAGPDIGPGPRSSP